MANIDPRFAVPFTTEPPTRQASAPQNGNDLDRNAFLNLLMTQLRFQDPLNPMDDRDFIAQMAQFSSLEQMQNLNSTFGRFQAFSMIGQTVSGFSRNPITGALLEITGRVDSVSVIAGEAWLNIDRMDGGDTVQLRASDVQLTADDSFFHTMLMLRNIQEHLTGESVISQSLALVGRTVQAITTDRFGNAVGFVEGEVEFVDFTAGFPTLAIGNERVQVGEVVSIGSENMIIGRSVGYFNDANVRQNGVITAINIRGEHAYAVIGGEQHRIDHINFLTEAFNLRQSGEIVMHDGEQVRVTDVTIQNGAVRVQIRFNDGETMNIPYATLINSPNAPTSVIGQFVGFYYDDVFTARAEITAVNSREEGTFIVIGGRELLIDSVRFLSDAIAMRDSQEVFSFEGEPHRIVSVRIQNDIVRVMIQNNDNGDIQAVSFSRLAN